MAEVKTLVLNLTFPPTIITAPTSEIALPKPVMIAEITEILTSLSNWKYIFTLEIFSPRDVSIKEFLILSTAGKILAVIIGVTIKTWAIIITFSV